MSKKRINLSGSNDGLDDIIAHKINNDRTLYPLRISKTTVIYVPEYKCNEMYAEQYRIKMNPSPKAHKYTGKILMDKEEISCMIAEGKSIREIAKELMVSTTTVNRKIKEFGLK